MKNKSPITLALLVIVFLLSGCGEKEYTDVEHLNRAKDFYDEQQMPSVIIELKNALVKNAENAEARWFLGKLYVELGFGEAGEKELQKAIELGLNQPQVFLELYESYLLQSQYKKVIDSLAEFESSEDKTSSRVYILLGRANLGLGELENAHEWFVLAKEKGQKINATLGFAKLAIRRNDFDRALQLAKDVLLESPDSIEAHNISARIYTDKNDYAKAMEHFNFIIEKQPHDLSFRLGRAEILISLDDFKSAEKDAQFTLKKSQNIPLAHFVMAKVFYHRDDLGNVQISLEKVIRGLPNHLPSFYMLGVVHFRQGNLEQSKYYLDRFLSTVKHHPGAEKLLVENYIKMGRPAETVPLLEQIVNSDEEPDLFVMAALGEAYLYTGETGKAVGVYTKAVGLWPERDFLQTRLAVAYLHAGDEDNAISKLRPLADINDAGRAQMLLINTYFDRGDKSSALELAASIVGKNSESEINNFIQGYAFRRVGAFDKAIMAYERSIKINPSYTPSILGQADIFLLQKQFEKAKTTYQGVLAIDENNIPSFLALAAIEHYQNNLDLARDWYSKAAQAEPENVEPVRGLVKIDILEGRSLQALNKSREFIDSRPESVDALALMAISLIANKESAGAETYLRRYLDERPEEAVYRILLSELLLQSGDFEGALREASMVLATMPEDKPTILRKINSLVALRRFDEARVEINKLKALSDEWNVDRIQGGLYAAEGRFKDSAIAYKVAYAKQPSRQALSSLVNALLKSGNSEDALDVLKQYLNKNPDDVEVLLTQGNLFGQLGDSRNAAESYQAVLANEPANVIALNNLAWIKLKSNADPVSALDYAEKAYRVAPSTSSVLDTYAWLLWKNDKPEKALELYGKLFQRQPQSAEYTYHYAVVLFGVEETERGSELKAHLRTLKGGDAFVKMLEAK